MTQTKIPKSGPTIQGLTSRVGFWAAIVATIVEVGSSLALVASVATGAAIYSLVGELPDAFWFAIAPALVVVMVCIHDSTPSFKSVLSLTGLAFIMIYTVTASFNYFTQLTVMRFALTYGPIQGLDLFNTTNFHSIIWELEALNYGFQGLGFLFIAPLFRGDRLQNAIGITLLINAANNIFSMVGYALDLNYVLLIGTFVVWIVFLPITTALLAIHFRRLPGGIPVP